MLSSQLLERDSAGGQQIGNKPPFFLSEALESVRRAPSIEFRVKQLWRTGRFAQAKH